MPFNTGYRGSVGGAVQTAYTDQPGVAVPGMVAYASDQNLKDSIFIGETDGIAAGRGVVLTRSTEAAYNLQRPNKAAFLPTVATTAADFGGILVFDEHMQSDENGVPGWALGRVGRVMRPERSGGRVYVEAKETVGAASTVNLVIVAGTDGLYEVGEFAPAALAGTALAGTSVALTNAAWETIGAAGDMLIIELSE